MNEFYPIATTLYRVSWIEQPFPDDQDKPFFAFEEWKVVRHTKKSQFIFNYPRKEDRILPRNSRFVQPTKAEAVLMFWGRLAFTRHTAQTNLANITTTQTRFLQSIQTGEFFPCLSKLHPLPSEFSPPVVLSESPA